MIPRAMARTRSDDDLLEELPPLDDGEDDDDRTPQDEDELDPIVDDGDTDDEVASDLAVGELLDPIRDEGGYDADDARELDVGGTEMVEDVTLSREDDDVAGMPGEDLSIGVDEVPDEGAEDLEGESQGQEGDEIDEAALPDIDADDDGQEGIAQEPIDLPDEVPLPPWAALRWEQMPLPLVADPMKAVALRDGRVVVAGQTLLELHTDDTGTLRFVTCSSPTPPPALAGLALPDDGPAVMASDGLEGAGNLFAFGRDRCLLARLSSDGALSVSRDRGADWVDVQRQDEVAGVGVDDTGRLVVAMASRKDRALLRSVDGLAWELDAGSSLGGLDWQRPVLVAARNESVAVASTRGVIDVSRGAQTPWTRTAVPPWLTSVAFVPLSGRDVLVGTLFLESEDKSYLFTIEPEGAIALVADLSPAVGVASSAEDDDSEGLGRAECIAWDEARGWLWVAGRFGLQAWRPALAA